MPSFPRMNVSRSWHLALVAVAVGCGGSVGASGDPGLSGLEEDASGAGSGGFRAGAGGAGAGASASGGGGGATANLSSGGSADHDGSPFIPSPEDASEATPEDEAGPPDASFGSEADAGPDACPPWSDADRVGLCPLIHGLNAGSTCPSCGNGVIDDCYHAIDIIQCPFADASACLVAQPEQCDGENLAGATCETLGFPSGIFGCDTGCSYDTRACVSCAADAHVLACEPLEGCSMGLSLALAADVDTIGAVWVVADSNRYVSPLSSPYMGTVEFHKYALDLTPLSQNQFADITDATNVVLARTMSGWILVVEHLGPSGGSPGEYIEIIPLDASGAQRGARQYVSGAMTPLLAPRGDASSVSGGPLLVWSLTTGGHVAALLADDGTFETSIGTIDQLDDGMDGCYGQEAQAAFTGDGFLHVECTPSGGAVRRIELDGTIGSATYPAGPAGGGSQIAWTGDHALLSYPYSDGNQDSIMLLKLDATGAAVGSPVAVASNDPYVYRSPVIPLDGGQLGVLISGKQGNDLDVTELDVVRLSAAMAPLVGPFAVMKDPTTATSWRAVRLGSRMVAGWIGGAYAKTGGPYLAVIAP